MRDKTKEGVCKALRNGTKLTKEESIWVLDKIKMCDSLQHQPAELETKYELFLKKLARLELTHFVDTSQYSKGYLDALKEFQAMLKGEGLL